MSEVGQSLFFLFPFPQRWAVLKRHPHSLLAQEELVCSGGRTRDGLVGKCPKVRGDGCPHTGFPLFPLIRHLPKILAEPQVMEVGRQMSEVGQSLLLLPPTVAVLKRRPRLSFTKILGRGRCVPEGGLPGLGRRGWVFYKGFPVLTSLAILLPPAGRKARGPSMFEDGEGRR
ncbi:MAG: hypothetical protein CVV03_06370 [Firmicutes bacterium HGW-Firmicutes-8]|nr:MAG: hypothetical protein CVV03_06370 [Firmicutes bacterium HGW-Firmicutes-8]